MTIKEADNFYLNDKKEYILEQNKNFLNWCKKNIRQGYYKFSDVKWLQETIDFIALWYEIKYPENELDYHSGIRYAGINNVPKLSKEMTFNQLLYRLPHVAVDLILCKYRGTGGSLKPVYDNEGNLIDIESYVYMFIKGKDCFGKTLHKLVRANDETGILEKDCDNLDSENMTLEDLLEEFEQQKHDNFDFSELKEVVDTHNKDLELRNIILQLVALKLLYSNKTNPEYGYIRAQRFIDEFNKKIPNLNLSSEQIEKIMSTDYCVDLKCVKDIADTKVGIVSENNNNESLNGKTLGQKIKDIFKKW